MIKRFEKAAGHGEVALLGRRCEEKPAKVDAKEVKLLLRETPGWRILRGELVREFKFADYYETMEFVNATAWISNAQNHHPDMEVGYNKVTMRYSTHSAGGLSVNDFICAARVNALEA